MQSLLVVQGIGHVRIPFPNSMSSSRNISKIAVFIVKINLFIQNNKLFGLKALMLDYVLYRRLNYRGRDSLSKDYDDHKLNNKGQRKIDTYS